MDMKEKLEVIAHLGDHITYKEDIGICYDSDLAKVIEDAYMTLKNSVTVQDKTEISDELLEQLRNTPIMVMTEEPAIEVVQEWISVKDRLPEKYGRYIALTPGYLKGFDQYNAWLIYYNPQIGFYDTDPQRGDIPMDDVTHWMPLPQPPKGE